MDIDQVYSKISGEFGPFQQKLFSAVAISQAFLALHQIQNVFVGAEPKFYCKRAVEKSLVGCPKLGNVSCDEYSFTGEDFTSVASEWGLVCTDAYKANLIQCFVMAGILVGSLVWGFLADKYGRRKVLYLSTIGMSLFTILGACSPFYLLYAFLRFCVGFSCAGCGMVGFVLLTEIIGQSKRSLAGMTMPLCFALGIILLSLMAYFVRHWRALSIATSVPPLLCGIYFYMVMPESPRWLYSQGRLAEAERLLELFAYKNTGQMPSPPITLAPLKLAQGGQKGSQSSQEGILDVLKHPELRRRTILNIYTWFVNCAVYYGLTMSAGNLGGNMYVSVALSGAVELPCYFLAFCMMENLGRRYTFSSSMFVGGFFCLAIMLVSPDQFLVRATCATLGKLGITVSFCVAWLYAAEMYPTNIRNKAVSVCNVGARVGGIISPMILAMGQVRPNMDFLTFGIMAAVAGFVSLRLPETAGTAMTETIADLDQQLACGPTSGSGRASGLSEDKLRLLQAEIETIEDDTYEN